MRDSYSPQNGNKRTPGSHGLDPKHGSSGPSDASRSSGAEKHEPDNAKDQNGQPQRDRKDCKHRRPALSLSRLGGGFNNLALSLRCHYRLNIISSQPLRVGCRSPATRNFQPCSATSAWARASAKRRQADASAIWSNLLLWRSNPLRLTPLSDSPLGLVETPLCGDIVGFFACCV